MFCPNCGQEMLEDSIVCPDCGAQLDSSLLEGEDINDLIELIEESDFFSREDEARAARAAAQQKRLAAKKKKNKKIGIAIIIILLILLFLGFVAAGFSYIKKQIAMEKAVDAFAVEVEALEDYLSDVEYESIQEEMEKLLKECETALENKDVDSFSSLRGRIDGVKADAVRLTEDISTVDELKAAYEERFATIYFISEELNGQMAEIFEAIQEDMETGDVEDIDVYREQLAQFEETLKQSNLDAVAQAKAAVEELDLEEMTEGEANTLALYLEDVDGFVGAEDYKNAVNKANTYKAYADLVVNAIEKRREESIAESIEESKRRAEEESRRQESKRQEEANKKPTSSGSYVCPQSNSRYLTEADVINLDAWGLTIARNEIYARHGRRFNDATLQAYFDKQSWYKGTIAPENFDPSVFNEYEETNIDFIRSYE